MDLLLTGATGFLGSQIATQWLARNPAARVACLVRAANPAEGRSRLLSALTGARIDQGMTPDPHLLDRVTVLIGELDDPNWAAAAASWMHRPAELIHCAANLSFREADRADVWRTNVGGTAALLAALPSLPSVAAFNYVSTAYVAGDREGEILERDTARPGRFNNPYEESKWAAEQAVRAECRRAGRSYRIFRPSIIIAHSVTHRLSTASGFYKVAEVLVQLGAAAAAWAAVCLPVPAGATLDLIPVDIVVTEMLDLIDLGPRSAGETYHLTSAAPLSLAAVLSELSPMSGVSIGTAAGTADTPSRLAALVMRSLRHYLPYFSYVRHFARHQAAARGAPHAQAGLPLDVEGLRAFLTPYLASRALHATVREPVEA